MTSFIFNNWVSLQEHSARSLSHAMSQGRPWSCHSTFFSDIPQKKQHVCLLGLCQCKGDWLIINVRFVLVFESGTKSRVFLRWLTEIGNRCRILGSPSPHKSYLFLQIVSPTLSVQSSLIHTSPRVANHRTSIPRSWKSARWKQNIQIQVFRSPPKYLSGVLTNVPFSRIWLLNTPEIARLSLPCFVLPCLISSPGEGSSTLFLYPFLLNASKSLM